MDRACRAMVAVAFFEPDREWAEGRFREPPASERPEIRGLAATCLGHLARIHRAIGAEAVAALRRRLDDPATAVHARDALDDVAVFAPDAPAR